MRLRPATEADVPAMNAIHAHYVLNTVVTFALDPLSEAGALDKFRGIRASGLPYIVATDDSDDKSTIVLGYTYLSSFRSALLGYTHTAELSLFCDPAHVSAGVGTALLTHLFMILRDPTQYPEYLGEFRRSEEGRVKEVMAVAALDVQGREEGWGLVKWYAKFGFEKVGHLKRVGYKFGRWLDTIYLQLSL